MSARDETPHTVLKKLGQKKCNGSWDASTENMTIQQIIEVSETKKDKLTGASQKARALEVMVLVYPCVLVSRACAQRKPLRR